MRKHALIIALICLTGIYARPLRIISYNVENLFDYRHDSLKNDYEYMPDGIRHWTYSRFKKKEEQIAQVIANAGEWKGAAIVGLCEVENNYCLKELCYQLSKYKYRYIHFESEDERGIDVGMLYQPANFSVIDSSALKVELGEDKTRDILFVTGIRKETKDTIYLFMCHLPSMLGGKKATDWKRENAKRVIQNKVDSILCRHPKAEIVVMGDMNSEPQNDLQSLENMMCGKKKNGGSHKYQGQWSWLDQVYLSASLVGKSNVRIYDADFLLEEDKKWLGEKPKRTFVGYKYQKDGYSDHLPILLDIK